MVHFFFFFFFFSKFSSLFHLKNHHSKDVHLKFWLKWSSCLAVQIKTNGVPWTILLKFYWIVAKFMHYIHVHDVATEEYSIIFPTTEKEYLLINYALLALYTLKLHNNSNLKSATKLTCMLNRLIVRVMRPFQTSSLQGVSLGKLPEGDSSSRFPAHTGSVSMKREWNVHFLYTRSSFHCIELYVKNKNFHSAYTVFMLCKHGHFRRFCVNRQLRSLFYRPLSIRITLYSKKKSTHGPPRRDTHTKTGFCCWTCCYCCCLFCFVLFLNECKLWLCEKARGQNSRPYWFS